MGNGTPYIPFYTSDFLAGTSGMTAETKGVYITLLCLIYETEAPISQPWDMLARRCGCTLRAFKKAVQALQIDAKVTITKDSIWSEKCDKHMADRRQRIENASAAAEKRWEKIKQKQPKSYASASIPQCDSESKSEPKSEPKSKSKPEPEPKNDDGDADADGRAHTRGDDQSPKNRPLSYANVETLKEQILETIGVDRSGIISPDGKMIGGMADMKEAKRWEDDLGLSTEEVLGIIREVMLVKGGDPPSSLKYFSQEMAKYAKEKDRPPLTPIDRGR